MSLSFDVLAEEVPHQAGDGVAVLLKRKMSSIEQVKLQIFKARLYGSAPAAGKIFF
jgi:hypothetical protein